MEEALSFFRAFEVWIYLLLGLGGLYYIRKFILAWQELRGAGFGLERDSAQARLNQSASVLVLLLTMAVTEFVLVSFVAPAVPGAIPLPTATLDLLATPTYTLSPVTTTPQAIEASGTDAPTLAAQSTGGGCLPDQVQISSPQTGEEVSGVVEVLGTADIPNFGFYKLGIKRPEDPIWATIQAGNQVRKEEKLGDWDTRRLLPGIYQLSIVMVDNTGQSSEPCAVEVNVIRAPDETPEP